MPIDLVRLVTRARPHEEDEASADSLRGRVIEALRGVHDPEIPVNIYDLGLIYRLEVSEDGEVEIDMTLTAPNCPVAEMMPNMVLEAVQAIDDVRSVNVDLVWEPKWDQSMMSNEARLALDMFA